MIPATPSIVSVTTAAMWSGPTSSIVRSSAATDGSPADASKSSCSGAGIVRNVDSSAPGTSRTP